MMLAITAALLEKKVFMNVEQLDIAVGDYLQKVENNAVLETDFCSVYTIARPILELVKNVLFFKPKWQKMLDILIKGLDGNCNQAG